MTQAAMAHDRKFSIGKKQNSPEKAVCDFYRGAIVDVIRGNISLANDSFQAVLLSPAYKPDLDAHTRWRDIARYRVSPAVPVEVGVEDNGDELVLTLGRLVVPASETRKEIGYICYFTERTDGGQELLVLTARQKPIVVTDLELYFPECTWRLKV